MQAIQASYAEFAVDLPSVGRSGYADTQEIRGIVVVRELQTPIEQIGSPVILVTHSMSRPYCGKLLEMIPKLLCHILATALGPMGNIQVVPEILHESAQSIEARLGPIIYTLDRTNPFVYS